jgi:predicted glycosyltransferase involved in capsule biosynthesis
MFNKRSFFSNEDLDTNIDLSGCIVIPWRETESRLKAFYLLKSWYELNFPNLKIILCDSGSEIFNLSASRNIGLKKAFDQDCDFVVVSDADVFVSKESLFEAIKVAIKNNSIANPYDLFIELTSEGTDMFFNNEKECIQKDSWKGDAPVVLNNEPSSLIPSSGVNVISKAVWEQLGGFDENFVGWGFEDNAYFLKYFDQYKNVYDYIPGIALSIFHKKEWDSNINNNQKYFYETYMNKEKR